MLYEDRPEQSRRFFYARNPVFRSCDRWLASFHARPPLRAFLFEGHAMPEKDLNNLSFLSFLAMMAFAAWGASVSYMNKVRKGMRFKWRDLFIDIFCSAFVGLLAGLAGVAANLNLVAIFVMVGIAGHMGPRFIGLLVDRAVKV